MSLAEAEGLTILGKAGIFMAAVKVFLLPAQALIPLGRTPIGLYTHIR